MNYFPDRCVIFEYTNPLIVNFEVVRLDEFSGSKATIYSIILEEDSVEDQTLFDKFLHENSSLYPNEIKDILSRLYSITHKTGAQDFLLKPNEGGFTDDIVALYDDPKKNLRLYAIRFGMNILILGGGGYKPKKIKALQENPKLRKENYILRECAKQIDNRIRDKGLMLIGHELIGDFNFYNDED